MSATPSPMQTPDLGGLLRRPASPPQPAAAPSSPSVAEPASQPEPAKPAKTRPARQASRSQPAAGTVSAPEQRRQYLRSIAVYLPRSLHQQVRSAATRQSTTATALMLAAVNSTHDQLAEALAQQTGEPATAGDLFEIPQAKRVAEPTVQTTIRVTDSQYRTLSELAAGHQVNRSQLLATAVRLYLS